MQDRFAQIQEEYIQPSENSYRGGYNATENLLSMSVPPTAIFAMDDTMAIGALAAAEDLGWRVPADLSIIGFDDLEVSAYVRPALTTVRQPMEKLGRKAVELLLMMTDGDAPSDPGPRLLLEPKLMIRDSCAPPRD
jgi:LacI family transcriptional regulator